MRRGWSAAFFAVGLACVGLACHAALRRTGDAALPPPGALLAAGAVLASGLLLAARGWVRLLAGAAPAPQLTRGFMISQLGKYVPGGIWLGVGQVGLAVDSGVPAARAAGAVGAFGLCFVVAAALLAGALAAVGPIGDGHAAVAVIGLAFPVLLHRRWMAAVAGLVVRRLGRRGVGSIVPAQAAILAAAGWSFASIGCSAIAYGLLVHSLDPALPVQEASAGFAIAWLAGYLVVGLPSGIGAREAVLVALLPAGAGTILAASLAQRILQMTAEAILAAATTLRARSSRSPEPAHPVRSRPPLPVEVPHA